MIQPKMSIPSTVDAYDWICAIDLVLQHVFIWVLNESSMGTRITQSVALNVVNQKMKPTFGRFLTTTPNFW